MLLRQFSEAIGSVLTVTGRRFSMVGTVAPSGGLEGIRLPGVCRFFTSSNKSLALILVTLGKGMGGSGSAAIFTGPSGQVGIGGGFIPPPFTNSVSSAPMVLGPTTGSEG